MDYGHLDLPDIMSKYGSYIYIYGKSLVAMHSVIITVLSFGKDFVNNNL